MGPGSASSSPAGCLDLAALDSIAMGQADAEAHLAVCERCRTLLEQMRGANQFLRRFTSGAPAAPSDPAPADPTAVRVKGYQIQCMIAVGGQGAVYRAVQTGTERAVAIKVPLADTLRRPAARYRFEREIELTARLDHAGIVRVIGPCELVDGRIGCVMEFIEGEPFDRWAARCRDSGRGAIRRIVEAGMKVADSIAYAHQRAVLHRDIKPSNVVVSPEGEPHVLDFGLAKALGEASESFATLTGAFVGTISYSAPEQIDEGVDAIDMRTDVYALGLLLYQAITGRLPHTTDVPTAEILRQIRELSPPRPSSLAAAVDEDLDAVLLRALAKEKDRRYASAAELREDLLAWLEGRAVRARIDSRWYLFRKTLARHRRVIALGALVFVAVLGGAGASAYNMIMAAEAQRREHYETLRASSEASRADAVQQVIDELLPMTEGGGGVSRENLDRLDAKIEAGLLRDRPLVLSSVRALLGSIYADRGVFSLGEYNYRQAIGISREVLGPDHPETAQLGDRLVGMLVERGKLDEAWALAREVLSSREGTLGPAHADIAESLVTLGQVELRRGDTAGAAEHAARAADILRNAPTATGQQSLACAALCAHIADAQGRADEALAQATDALRLALVHYSDEHPVVVHALRDFAAFTAAEGDAHTAGEATALADALSTTRTADRPAAVWEQLLALKARILGSRAPQLASTYTFLGLALEREGDQAGSAEAHFAALRILRETEGEDSMAFADCSYYLQYPLGRLGRWEEWAALLKHRYQTYRRECVGGMELGIVVAHREWAMSLANLGRDDEAEAELLATLVEIASLCHDDPFETIRAKATLTEVLAARGDIDRAESLAVEVTRAASVQQTVERQRVAIVLALAAANRRDFDTARPLLDTYIALPDLWQSNTTGPRGISRRMVERLLACYREAEAPEPPAVAKLRLVYGLDPE